LDTALLPAVSWIQKQGRLSQGWIQLRILCLDRYEENNFKIANQNLLLSNPKSELLKKGRYLKMSSSPNGTSIGIKRMEK